MLKSLVGALDDCRVVRCPGGNPARTFIASHIVYSLLLLDEGPPGATGLELASYARGLPHRERTPIIILSEGGAVSAGAGVSVRRPDDPKSLARAIRHLLAACGPELSLSP